MHKHGGRTGESGRALAKAHGGLGLARLGVQMHSSNACLLLHITASSRFVQHVELSGMHHPQHGICRCVIGSCQLVAVMFGRALASDHVMWCLPIHVFGAMGSWIAWEGCSGVVQNTGEIHVAPGAVDGAVLSQDRTGPAGAAQHLS